jgi:branched-chain amino acid transport system substrate-binding protein
LDEFNYRLADLGRDRGGHRSRFNETDFTPYSTTILAAKPDFVMGSLFGADGMNFTKQAKGYGYFEKLKASNVYEFNLLRALGNEMVEGAIGFSRGEFFCVDTPEMEDFVQKFRSAYGGEYPTLHSVTGRDSIYCIKQAMEKVRSTNKEKVRDALTGMEFTGPRGKLYFRKCDNQINGTNYVGFTKKTPEYPFYVYKDILSVPGEQTWASCEEVAKLRSQK